MNKYKENTKKKTFEWTVQLEIRTLKNANFPMWLLLYAFDTAKNKIINKTVDTKMRQIYNIIGDFVSYWSPKYVTLLT